MNTYNTAYQNLPEQLVELYPELNFENHCYLRIALDQLCKQPWHMKIRKPAYKHLTQSQLEEIRNLLTSYKTQKTVLLQHHQQSLVWRQQATPKQQTFTF